MFKAKKITALTLSAVLTAGLAGGVTTVQAAEEPVELIWQMPWSGTMEDFDKINDALNKVTLEKINCTVKIIPTDLGQYNEKMNMINSGGEYYDLAYTCNWNINDYYQNVANGGFLELDGLLEEYAPGLVAEIPQKFFDALRIDGKLYAVPNYQIAVETYGILTDMGFMKQVEEATGYAIDLDSMKTLEDIEPALAAIKEANVPKTMGYCADSVGFTNYPAYFGYDTVSSPATPGWVKIDDETTTVVNQYDSEEFRQYARTMKAWFDAGYIRPDAALLPYGDHDKGYDTFGPQLVFVKPGDAETYTNIRGTEIVIPNVTTPLATTQRACATMTAVSSQTKYPEKCVELLNLMATDPVAYNIISFGLYDNGEEGTYFVKSGDNRVEYKEGFDASNCPYTMGAYGGWLYGNQFLAYLKPGDKDTVWEETKKLNEEAMPSPLMGFVCNVEEVKTEVAACQTVLDEFIPALVTGGVEDPDKTIDEMNEMLKTAGVDTMIEKFQAQIDAWKAEK